MYYLIIALGRWLQYPYTFELINQGDGKQVLLKYTNIHNFKTNPKYVCYWSLLFLYISKANTLFPVIQFGYYSSSKHKLWLMLMLSTANLKFAELFLNKNCTAHNNEILLTNITYERSFYISNFFLFESLNVNWTIMWWIGFRCGINKMKRKGKGQKQT